MSQIILFVYCRGSNRQLSIKNYYYRFLLNQLIDKTQGCVLLNMANGLWAQKGYPFLDSYLTFVKTKYSSELKNVDFMDDAERETASKDINEWVEQKTNDKIKDILGESDLQSSTRLVLVNAIYFYGDWQTQFEKAGTVTAPFFLSTSEQIQHLFMNRQGSYNYYEDSKIKAIELPYKDSKASMVIFLPNNKDGIAEFEKSVDYNYYQKVIDAFKSNEVRTSIPKFQITCKFTLAKTLSTMGMGVAFTGAADFSGMTGNRDFFISKVIHQSFINVDEKGTEAAAATVVMMDKSAMRIPNEVRVFKADHPFLFVIKENSTGSILFMGKIMKPEVSK